MRKLIAICLMLMLGNTAWATHIGGGEITYRHLGGMRYEFKLKLIRDCSDCKLGGNGGGQNTTNCADISELLVYTAGGGDYKGKISLDRQSVTDITPVCSAEKSICDNGYNYGYEVHVFTGSFDFTSSVSSDKCQFDIVLSADSRSEAWGLSENYFNYCRLNLCNSGINNQSAESGTNPWHYLVAGQPVYYYPFTKDADGDSLSFKLVSAQKGFGKSITYGSGRSATHPVTANCDACTPDPDASVPEGFYIDPRTGYMVFAPVSGNEKGYIAVEITEWRKVNRKMVEMGVTRRDYQYLVISLGSNNAPVLRSPAYSYQACVGAELCIDLSVSDPPAAGVKDVVTLSVQQGLPGGRLFTVNSGQTNSYDAGYCWKPDISDAGKTYELVILAEDNGCPLKLHNQRRIRITVNPAITGTMDISAGNCGQINVNSSLKGNGSAVPAWFLFNAGRVLTDSREGQKVLLQAEQGGKHYVRMEVSNQKSGCSLLLEDSVLLAPFTRPGFTLPSDTMVCAGTRLTIAPSGLRGDYPLSFDWMPGFSHDRELITEAAEEKEYSLKVTDRNGCSSSAAVQVKLFPKGKLKLRDTAVCSVSESSIFLGSLSSFSGTIASSMRYSLLPGSSDTVINGIWSSLILKKGSMNQVVLTVTDKNLCIYRDTAAIGFEGVKQSKFTSLRSVCENGEVLFDLDREASIAFDGGKWIFPAKQELINGSLMNISGLAPGKYSLKYENLSYVCPYSAAFELVIRPVPQIDTDAIYGLLPKLICRTAGILQLPAVGVNARWYGTGVSGNQFDPSSVEPMASHADVYLSVSEGNPECVNTRRFRIPFTEPPVLDLRAEKASVCAGEPLLISVNTNELNAGLDWKGPGAVVQDGILRYRIVVPAPNYGKYTAEAWVNGNGGCAAVRKTAEFEIRQMPVAAWDMSLQKGCSPFAFRNEITGITPSGSSVSWESGSGIAGSGKSCTIQYKKAGFYTPVANINYQGCVLKLNHPGVQVLERPVADMQLDPGDVLMADYPMLKMHGLGSGIGPLEYRWEWNGYEYRGLSGTARFPVVPGKYPLLLEVASSEGCKDSNYRVITVEPVLEMFVPTAFVPGGDGPQINNIFKPAPANIRNYHFQVFDRWGALVFETTDLSAGWDGNILGAKAEGGVYAWRITGTDRLGREKDWKGTVTLIR